MGTRSIDLPAPWFVDVLTTCQPPVGWWSCVILEAKYEKAAAAAAIRFKTDDGSWFENHRKTIGKWWLNGI